MKSQSLAATVFCVVILSAGWALAQDPFAANVRPTDPLSPAEEQKSFRLPPGFEIQLVASEPDIFKPMNLAFDAKGRLWVTDSTEYPFPVPPGQPGRDTVKILEDTDGDGRADRITTFADGLNIPIGLYPYRDGVVVFSIPNIWYLRDTDGDGRADERTVLYGPMGFERDTHGLNNSFTRGFDGWLYACHGFNNQTTVAGTDGHTIKMHSGNTYRMRLDGSRIEHFTWGQVNPFGMTTDPLFNLFTADCHSKPIYQLLRGGYYPSFGKPHDGLGFVPPMMDHLHGSTAIAGIALYTGENFPPEYRNNIFTGNVMTSRVNRNSLVYHGSTLTAREEPDFVSTTDPWFRPVDVQVGPDGALYIADFYNRIIGHYEVPLDHPGRDRTSGRIWRIVYTGDAPDSKPARRPADLSTADTEALIAALDDVNLVTRSLATNELTDRVGSRAASAVRTAFSSSSSPRVRSHVVWILHRFGDLANGGSVDPVLKQAARDETHRDVRVHAMKVLSETSEWSPEHRRLALAGLQDQDAFVRRAAADALGQHPHPTSVRPLLEALESTPEADDHLRYVVRMALRNHFRASENMAVLGRFDLKPNEARSVARVLLAVHSPEAGTFLLEHVGRYEEPQAAVAEFLRHAVRTLPADRTADLARFVQERFPTDIDFQRGLLAAIHTGFQQRGLPANRTVRQWGRELAQALLDSVGNAAAGWTNAPIPGKRSIENPWVLQQRPSADGNTEATFLCSFPRGEHLTGILRSREFDVPESLAFYTAGHLGFPNRPPLPHNVIRLRDAETHEILAEAQPPRNDTAQRVAWDLRQHTGRRAYLEIVDGDDGGGYAWLAVGRFEPSVVPLPKVDPSLIARRQRAAAEIAANFQLANMQPQLAAVLTGPTTDLSVRATAARALVAFQPDSRLAALAALVAELAVPTALRERISQVIVTRHPEMLEAVLAEAVRTTPARLQAALAQELTADRMGAESLLKLVKQGHASPRLLLRATIRERLTSVGLKEIDSRIEQLTADLPSVDEAFREVIAQRIQAHSRSHASAAEGAAVFAKHCAACHQLDGKGPLIGPQLDGIGNRGLERLVEDILDPNRNVDVAFRTTTIVTADGKIRTGLVRREEGETLVLVDNQGKEFSISTDDIEEKVPSRLSLMPENVIELIPEADFHDLLAFLLSKRGPRPDSPSN